MAGNARVIEIADAVVAALNAGTFSEAFVAVRYYKPEFTLKELNALHVSVVPGGRESEPLTRASLQDMYMIQLAIQKRPDEQVADDMDPYMVLADEFMGFFLLGDGKMLTLPDGTKVRCIKARNVPIYSEEHIEDLLLVTIPIELDFRVLGT